jgi:hypothetical protein
MTTTPGIREIRTRTSNQPADDFIRHLRNRSLRPMPSETLESEQDLEAAAGDFITRQVLEKDSVIFEG